jgi:hypothetical protein
MKGFWPMSESPYGGKKLKPEEIKKLIEKLWWPLEDGILICMGIKPGTFNWDNYSSDIPIRLRIDCLKAIKRGEILDEVCNGQRMVPRRDLIPFCVEMLDKERDGKQIHTIWNEYLAEKGIKKKSTAPLTEKRKKMQHLFIEAYLKKYKENPKLYDAYPKRINKSAIARSIVEKYPDYEWKWQPVRDTGKPFTVFWATKCLEKEKVAIHANPIPTK